MSICMHTWKRWGSTTFILLLVGICIHVDRATAKKSEYDSGTEEERDLIQWVRERGGIVNVTVGKACPMCLRGLIAPTDIPPAGLIIRLPSQALIKLQDLGHTGFAAEYARDLIYRMHINSTFNQTYGAYLKTLPQYSELFSPEVWEARHESILQTPLLETLVSYSRRSTEEIYNGTYREFSYPPMFKLLGQKASNVDLSTFNWISTVIGSRFFGAALGKDDKVTHVLAPVMDMANHGDQVEGDVVNAYQTTFNGTLMLRALRPIKKGEEIRFNYQPGVNHRPDMSLLVYGFFQKRKKTTLMCAVDLPTFSMAEQYAPTPESDDLYYGPKGKFNTDVELRRLERLLSSAPTTLKQDEKLLKGKFTDWRDQMLIEFRVERKRALVAAIKKVKKELKKNREAREEL